MKKLFKGYLLIILLFLTSCSKQDVLLVSSQINNSNTEIIKKLIKEKINIYTVIAHNNLVNEDIDKYYKVLKYKYEGFDNIVLIGSNNITSDGDSGFLEDGKYCFQGQNLDCVNGKKLDFFASENFISTFEKKGDFIETTEKSIGNHFSFINKYFPETDIYGIVLNTNYSGSLLELKQKLESYNFIGKTLFIASVDFSHHVNEKIAVFHDLNTLNYLNGDVDSKLEVDCPNCLYLEKNLAKDDKKSYFDLYNRTSVDSKLKINSNYENTTHIYGEFTSSGNLSYENAFSGSYLYSKFENTSTGNLNQNEVSGIFFGDAHFTRGFTYKSSSPQSEYLKCFYSNKDLSRTPEFWQNRLLYSFDLVGANLETSVGIKDECVKSNKSIVFQTDPKYLQNFIDIGFNVFNIANNHIYDCGETGYVATKKYLDENKLGYFGDGRGKEENILKKEVNGTKIAFVGFNDIGAQIDENTKAEKIKQLTLEGYIVIVNIHWGFEYVSTSNDRQKKIAKLFVDSGAKFIIGHHPHVVQEYEVYKGVPIFYSLGNFIFDQPFEETLKGYGVEFLINDTGVKYNLLEFERDSKSYMIDCDSFK
ncbi:MAG: CapA family protein [Candidatus Gracilibacteria bacterium]|nr:CapA family protein [Candidatus Gracilibacteria bacterium]